MDITESDTTEGLSLSVSFHFQSAILALKKLWLRLCLWNRTKSAIHLFVQYRCSFHKMQDILILNPSIYFKTWILGKWYIWGERVTYIGHQDIWVLSLVSFFVLQFIKEAKLRKLDCSPTIIAHRSISASFVLSSKHLNNFRIQKLIKKLLVLPTSGSQAVFSSSESLLTSMALVTQRW